jgi:lysophospholipid acyltransferase (LPLAT)-like uncharacterized protein
MMNSVSVAVFSLFNVAVSRASYVIILLLGFTLRIERDNQTGVDLTKNQLIYCVWHKNTFCPMFLHRWEQIILFVAAGRRGELFGAILKLLGYSPFSLANYSVRSLVREMKSGHSVCMAADGPDGPAFYPKDGTKWLATLSKTPATALDVQYSCAITLAWRWDRYQVPLPFSKARIVYSPLFNADSDWSLLGGRLGK